METGLLLASSRYDTNSQELLGVKSGDHIL